MFDEERKAGRLAKGTRGLGAPKKGGLKKYPPNEVTYEHLLGPQHKQLSDWARKLAKPSDAWFEEFVREAHRCEILSIYSAVHFLKSGRHRQRTNAAAWGGPETWAKPPVGWRAIAAAREETPAIGEAVAAARKEYEKAGQPHMEAIDAARKEYNEAIEKLISEHQAAIKAVTRKYDEVARFHRDALDKLEDKLDAALEKAWSL
jgi:hypothetical protein